MCVYDRLGFSVVLYDCYFTTLQDKTEMIKDEIIQIKYSHSFYLAKQKYISLKCTNELHMLPHWNWLSLFLEQLTDPKNQSRVNQAYVFLVNIIEFPNVISLVNCSRYSIRSVKFSKYKMEYTV